MKVQFIVVLALLAIACAKRTSKKEKIGQDVQKTLSQLKSKAQKMIDFGDGNKKLSSKAMQSKKPTLLQIMSKMINTKSSGCGLQMQQINGQDGMIELASYGNYEFCMYGIEADEADDKIAMSFESFNVETHPTCVYDSLCVFNTSNDAALGCYCGELESSFTVVFNTSSVYMIFSSDGSVTGDGFKIDYAAVTDSSSYYRSVDSKKKAQKDKAVEKTVTKKHTAENSLSKLFSDIFSSKQRWTRDEACNGGAQYIADTWTPVQSPRFGSRNYPNDANCRWEIESPNPEDLIALGFSTFELEESSECRYDSLCVYNGTLEDGEDWSEQQIGCYCGFASGLNVATNSSFLTLVINTDGSVTEAGFDISVSYYSAPEDYNYYDYSGYWDYSGSGWDNSGSGWDNSGSGYDYSGDHSSGSGFSCNAVYTGDSGSLTSPNFPDNYYAGLNCNMRIEASPGQTLVLYFTNFDVEYQSPCIYDSVTIIENGNGLGTHTHGSFCGDSIPAPIIGGNNFTVIFSTDGSVNNSGFRLNWTPRA